MCEKNKTSVAVISQRYELIWMECGVLLKLDSVVNRILILSHPFSIKGREPYLSNFIEKT